MAIFEKGDAAMDVSSYLDILDGVIASYQKHSRHLKILHHSKYRDHLINPLVNALNLENRNPGKNLHNFVKFDIFKNMHNFTFLETCIIS